jgi:hypothetical protein
MMNLDIANGLILLAFFLGAMGAWGAVRGWKGFKKDFFG